MPLNETYQPSPSADSATAWEPVKQCKHPTHVTAGGVAQHRDDVRVGVARVYHTGASSSAASRSCASKAVRCASRGRVIVVVVEPTLADGDRAEFAVVTNCVDVSRRIELDGVVWMHAGRVKHETVVRRCDECRTVSGGD
jgi:hypothetical protein